jgi:hypothetical protein
LDKVASHTLDDGTPAHSFATLLAALATIVRSTCRSRNAGADAPTFELLTTPNPRQQRAFELVQKIRVQPATATPISPQVSEMHNQTRLASPRTSA